MAKDSHNDNKNPRQDKTVNQPSVNRESQSGTQSNQSQKKQPGKSSNA